MRALGCRLELVRVFSPCVQAGDAGLEKSTLVENTARYMQMGSIKIRKVAARWMEGERLPFSQHVMSCLWVEEKATTRRRRQRRLEALQFSHVLSQHEESGIFVRFSANAGKWKSTTANMNILSRLQVSKSVARKAAFGIDLNWFGWRCLRRCFGTKVRQTPAPPLLLLGSRPIRSTSGACAPPQTETAQSDLV